MIDHVLKIHILLPAAVCLLSGCSAPPIRCTSPVDNPAHHFVRSMEAVEERYFDFARDRLNRAVFCDKRFSPAYSGLALVMAEKAREQTDGSHRALHVQRVRENIRLGKKHADTPVDKFLYHLAQIRIGIILQEEGWLKTAEDSFAAAGRLNIDDGQLPYYQGKEVADYFMALAYMEARDLPNARDRYAAVLAAGRDRKWDEEAERGWKKVDKVLRAAGGMKLGEVSRKISLQDSLSRGNMAALLIQELKLDTFLRASAAGIDGKVVPADVPAHPFREEILIALELKVRGLEARFDERTRTSLFFPAETVSRSEMALMLDDLLTKVGIPEPREKKESGKESAPLSDVRPVSPFYEAVLRMTRHGIMEEEITGEFRPNDVVDGAEAILALRKLKQILAVN